MSRPDKTSDDSSVRYLVYVISALCAAGLAFSVLRILLPSLRVVVPILVGWWLWQRFRNFQKSQQDALNAIFYQLIQEHQGRVTVLDFAMSTQLSAVAAREFLDARAKEFSAHFEVTEQGDTFYVFRTLRSYPFQPSAAKPTNPQSIVSEKISPLPAEPLTQAQLARRLGVNADTIRRKKFSSDLAAWTQTRDPDGFGWMYVVQTRRFLPSETVETKESNSPDS
ncbi:hypothetical protein K9N68_14545 [Kovacikia minuta CCNUW1]|uniref:hypothetical protein n=1 Tax=Kovacikia minuta TaxID=2931930 RepID=UPI001CCEE8E9|nr:hypothetical protein [Kovacikia minuta]UBF28947.1 hypothetical protein K9N68_14545 [Kovacikia minuta CCNUW1]